MDKNEFKEKLTQKNGATSLEDEEVEKVAGGTDENGYSFYRCDECGHTWVDRFYPNLCPSCWSRKFTKLD